MSRKWLPCSRSTPWRILEHLTAHPGIVVTYEKLWSLWKGAPPFLGRSDMATIYVNVSLARKLARRWSVEGRIVAKRGVGYVFFPKSAGESR